MQPVDPRIAAQRPTGFCSASIKLLLHTRELCFSLSWQTFPQSTKEKQKIFLLLSKKGRRFFL